MKTEGGGGAWHQRFRAASISAGVGAVLWTLLMVLPFAPFSSIPPILVGGGPGTWLLLGYVLYLVAGFGGLTGMSVLLYLLERREPKRANGGMMGAGLALYYAGTTLASALLGLAGYSGGYAFSIQHLPDPSIETVLLPYVEPVTLAVLVSCAGALIVFLDLAFAGRGPTRA